MGNSRRATVDPARRVAEHKFLRSPFHWLRTRHSSLTGHENWRSMMPSIFSETRLEFLGYRDTQCATVFGPVGSYIDKLQWLGGHMLHRDSLFYLSPLLSSFACRPNRRFLPMGSGTCLHAHSQSGFNI